MQTKLLLTFALTLASFSEAVGSSPKPAEMQVLDAKSIIGEVKKSKADLKVVNVWASWCAPCREELPAFAKVEKDTKDVAFFYISGDDEKEAPEALRAILATGVTGTKFRLNPINENAFREFSPVWSGSLPTTIFYYGQSKPDIISKPLSEKQLRAAIKERLAKLHRNRLHEEKSSPKVNSSQGKKMNMKPVEFESKKPNPEFGTVHDIVAEELNKKRSDVVLIDVRQPEEFTGELSHIPGATLTPLATLPDNLEKLPKDKAVVFVCRSGGRSARAAALAQANGFDNVYNLKGGMIRWNELRLPLGSAEKESK